MCFLLFFVCCLFVFVLIFLCVFLYCISWLCCVVCIFFVDIFFIFNLNFNCNRQNIITMEFQDASCAHNREAESVLSSLVEPPSLSLAVSVSSSMDVTAMTRRSTWSSKAMSVS